MQDSVERCCLPCTVRQTTLQASTYNLLSFTQMRDKADVAPAIPVWGQFDGRVCTSPPEQMCHQQAQWHCLHHDRSCCCLRPGLGQLGHWLTAYGPAEAASAPPVTSTHSWLESTDLVLDTQCRHCTSYVRAPHQILQGLVASKTAFSEHILYQSASLQSAPVMLGLASVCYCAGVCLYACMLFSSAMLGSQCVQVRWQKCYANISGFRETDCSPSARQNCVGL